MSATIEVKATISGGDWDGAAQAIIDKLALVVDKSAHDIEAHAKQNAPVRTGFLRNSIQASQDDDLNWTVEVGAEYGIFLEFGTVKMTPRPYLIPACDLVRPAFIAAVEKVVG